MTAYTSLRDFIDRLEKDGDLVRITEQVSTDREMTEIHKRVLHKGGPALLFENVVQEDGRKAEMPVLCNLFGTRGLSPKPFSRLTVQPLIVLSNSWQRHQ